MSYETEPKWTRIISHDFVSFKVKGVKFSDDTGDEKDQQLIEKDFFNVRSDLIIKFLSEYTGKMVMEVDYHLI